MVAYAGAFRGTGASARLGIWGVRIGWLAQTALLIAQMLDSDGFPWGTWAGALNLFVWLVVGAYLIWGCTPRYRMLGLAVMPFAVALLVAAWAGGGTGVVDARHGRLAARAPRRPDARGPRRADARGRPRRPLPLAGASPEAARHRAAAAQAAAARVARPALRPHRLRLARRPLGRHRRRPRQLQAGATSTCRWPSRSRSGR